MKLVQSQGWLRGKATYHLDKDDVLHLTVESLTRKSEYKFLLDQFDHRYERHKAFSVFAFCAFIALSLLAIILLFSGWVGMQKFTFVTGVQFFVGTLCVFGAALAAERALKSRLNIISFNDPHGRRLLNINGTKPSTVEVDNFCDSLSNRISAIRYDGEMSETKKKEIYMKHLEFLLEHEVILQSEFNDAVKRLNKKKKKVLKMVQG